MYYDSSGNNIILHGIRIPGIIPKTLILQTCHHFQSHFKSKSKAISCSHFNYLNNTFVLLLNKDHTYIFVTAKAKTPIPYSRHLHHGN